MGRIDPEPKYFLRRVNQLEMGAIAGLRVGLLSTYSPARRTQAWPRSHVEQWIHFTLIRTQWHQITKHHHHNVVCIWGGPHIIRYLLQCCLREAFNKSLEDANQKLWITRLLTGVRCRATSVAKNLPDTDRVKIWKCEWRIMEVIDRSWRLSGESWRLKQSCEMSRVWRIYPCKNICRLG